MCIPCTKAACLIWAWRVDSTPLHFTAQHLDVNPQTGVQLLWQSRKRGALQGGVHLSHRRIASLGYNAITWHYLTISNSSYQFGTGGFYLNYYFRHLHLGCGHLLVSVTPSCTISDGSVLVSSCTSGRAWTWLYCRPGAPRSSNQGASCKTSPPDIVTPLQLMLFRRAE